MSRNRIESAAFLRCLMLLSARSECPAAFPMACSKSESLPCATSNPPLNTRSFFVKSVVASASLRATSYARKPVRRDFCRFRHIFYFLLCINRAKSKRFYCVALRWVFYPTKSGLLYVRAWTIEELQRLIQKTDFRV